MFDCLKLDHLKTNSWMPNDCLKFSESCWDFSNKITNGTVVFSKADLTEGTVATVNCTKGELVGTNVLNCIEGQWNLSLPNCSIIGKNLTIEFFKHFGAVNNF